MSQAGGIESEIEPRGSQMVLNNEIAKNYDEFKDFEPNDEDTDSDMEYGPEYLIHTRKQRIEYLRKRVSINPQKVQPNEISALYKIVLIGDAGTGKSSLLLRFSDNIFNKN